MWKLLACSLGCLLWGVSSVWSQSSSLSALFESSPTTDLPKLEIQAVLVPEIITPGAETELQVQVFIPAGWHIYSIKPAGEFGPEPTTLTILSGHAIVTPLQESLQFVFTMKLLPRSYLFISMDWNSGYASALLPTIRLVMMNYVHSLLTKSVTIGSVHRSRRSSWLHP
jgi:hypothetical protein